MVFMILKMQGIFPAVPQRSFRIEGLLQHLLAAALVLGVAGSPSAARAQFAPGPTIFSPPELEQLVAPVALYPDQLLGQVLMAATYPLEVVQAARWVRDPANSALRGEALNAALAEIDWDPSVKSLVPFPQVLETMDANLDWMQKLGDAFLGQQAALMDAVQHLRRRALADGRLTSTAQQVVITEGDVIVIHTASPEVVYVPYYDPYIVYGSWPYPAYPPYYFPPPPSYYVEASVVPGFFFFAGGVFVVHWLWDWHRWDWHRHYIHIDTHRYNVIHVRRPPIKRDVWVHDYQHRRGVPYPSPTLNKRYARPLPPTVEIRRDYRGYEPGHRVTAPPTQYKSAPAPTTRMVPHVSAPATKSPSPRAIAPKPGVPGKADHGDRQMRSRAITPTPKVSVPRAASQRPPSQSIQAQPRTPPAFEGYSRGADVRREAARGRESRQATTTGRSAPSSNARSSRNTRPAARPDNKSQSRPERQSGDRSRR